MRILSVENFEKLSSQTEGLLDQLQKAKNRSLRGFFPAGKSALGLYQIFRQKQARWQKQFQFIQIDEFQDSRGGQGFFLEELKGHFLETLNLMPQAEWIHPDWQDEDFDQHIHKVLQKPIDFAVLGLGPNGHVGFHEPGQHGAEFLGGLVHLSEESFRRVPGAPSSRALTFGTGSFLQAEEIFLLVTGEGKERAFQQFLQVEPQAQIPVTLLKTHPKLTVLTTLSGSMNGKI